jgi:hypothetical protein
MCVGLVLHLLNALLPAHGWPEKLRNPGAQKFAHNDRAIIKCSAQAWDARCYDGIIRARIGRLPPFPGIQVQAWTANCWIAKFDRFL